MISNVQSWWKKVFPSVAWLRDYKCGWFHFDIAAGVTLADYLLPSVIGAIISLLGDDHLIAVLCKHQ
jgi:hypothetical protein